jgi:hypothetical protein
MEIPYPCHTCGRPGSVVRLDAKGRTVYRCRTADCDVVEYDRDLVLLRQGLPLAPAAPPRVRMRRAR